MPLEDLMWVEKYRPTSLAELVDQSTIKQRLEALIQKKQQLPHLLFAGPPGSGKTTTAMIVAMQILGDYWRDYTLSLNASDERGLEMVRDKIKTFARYSDRREGVPFRLIILDEADEMAPLAQPALRRIMEETAAYTRFILIANYSSGIIEAIQSRCAIFRFQRLDEASVTEHLKAIARKEKLKHVGDSVFAAIYEATQGDLRQAINLMQAASASGEMTTESVKTVTGATVKARVSDILSTAIGGDFDAARTKMIELTRVYGIPERDFLKFANEALGSLDVPDMAEAISILAEYDFRLVQGSQPELQLTAMLAQLSSLKRKGD
ncbi:MAG: replication factor C small subunit [Thaumarchaeota archaeon]|nr:replication factor C small subunit [Nitrososphaerota archaeon]